MKVRRYWPMSALGQKQTSRHLQSMSALPPIADIGTQPLNVRFVPEADIGLMGCTVMKSEKALDDLLVPPKADHCGLR
jgi:hypothetical protein